MMSDRDIGALCIVSGIFGAWAMFEAIFRRRRAAHAQAARTAATAPHTSRVPLSNVLDCCARRCTEMVPLDGLMCARHWRMLSIEFQVWIANALADYRATGAAQDFARALISARDAIEAVELASESSLRVALITARQAGKMERVP